MRRARQRAPDGGRATRAARGGAREGRRVARAARAVGFAAGLAAVAVALHAWAIASAGTALGMDLTIVATAPGELAVAPAGVVLRAHGLQRGRAVVRGAMTLRNVTAVPVRVRVRALPSTRELDRALELSLTSRGRTIAAGSVAELRRWSRGRMTLGVRESAPLELRARLRRPAPGLIADLVLELEADVGATS